MYVYYHVVARRTWIPTTMMSLMARMRGSIITLLSPLVGMIPETANARLPMHTQASAPRTITRTSTSAVEIALYHPPCWCEKAHRSHVRSCVLICLLVEVCQ